MSTSSKNKTAAKLGISVITEAEFLELLGTN
jgi:NAD-dependent DNA ligase